MNTNPLRPPSLLGVLIVVVASLTLSTSAEAQVTIRNLAPPWDVPFEGGPGNTTVVGTDGSDVLTDLNPNDQDSIHDAPGGPDCKPDKLNARDGDNNDSMWGGPEDTFDGDPGDKIYIFAKGGTSPLWCGTVAEYRRIRAIIRWVRDRLQNVLPVAKRENVSAELWQEAFETISTELADLTPSFGEEGSTVLYPDIFEIGPYAWGVLPASPLECLNWMPYDEEEDPVAATSELEFTSEQFSESVFAAQYLLAFLSDSLSDE